jgi:serine/threonine-protein kinase
MVSKSGEVLLTDFGVAKAVAETAHQQSAVKGKVPYMSPEQLRAERLDGRADLFSLGVVLFEATSGERPFRGEHDPSTIMKILQGDRASLTSIVPGTPPVLSGLIESLLEVDRDKRPKDAAAVVELLDPLLPGSKARRELGAMAAEARNERLSSRTTPIPSDPSDTSGVGLSSANAAAASEPRQSRRTGLWILAIVLAVIATWAVVTSGPEPPAKTLPDAQLAPVADEVVESLDKTASATGKDRGKPTPEPENSDAGDQTDRVGTTGADDVTTAPGSAADSKTQERAVAPARLKVHVFPWGDVWINGRRRGAAPLERVVLKPGRYRVSAGQGKPSQTKRVVLKEGERKTLEFDLTQ